MKYTIVLTKDPEHAGIYNASVPALPGCFSWGRTKRIAYARAKEAIRGYLKMLIDRHEPIPTEAESREFEVSVP